VTPALRKFLDDEISVYEKYAVPAERRCTRIERLAELIFVNGGLDVGSWGSISFGGPYGRHGLTSDEANEMMTLGGILRGIDLCDKEVGGEIHREVKAVWAKKKADFEAEMRSMDDLATPCPASPLVETERP